MLVICIRQLTICLDKKQKRKGAMFVVCSSVFIFLMLTAVAQIQNRPACIFAIALDGSWPQDHPHHQNCRPRWAIGFGYELQMIPLLVPRDRPWLNCLVDPLVYHSSQIQCLRGPWRKAIESLVIDTRGLRWCCLAQWWFVLGVQYGERLPNLGCGKKGWMLLWRLHYSVSIQDDFHQWDAHPQCL